MATASRPRKRTRGEIEPLPSGSLRVPVQAGIDPVPKEAIPDQVRAHRAVRGASPGPQRNARHAISAWRPVCPGSDATAIFRLGALVSVAMFPVGSLFLGLALCAIGLLILYGVIRLAVRHAIMDADEHRSRTQS